MSFLTQLLNNEAVQALVVFGLGWITTKLAGRKVDSKAAKVANAIATASAQMLQLVVTAPDDMTPERMIIQCKGVVAIQFAKAGFTEAQRLTYQPLIDVAISKAIAEWMKLHAQPKTLTPPIAAKLPR